jgi:thymidylate synthase (FAD)
MNRINYDAELAAQEAAEEHRRRVLSKWGEPTEVGPDGHVRLVDFMGSDAAIPQAARVSYGAGTKTVREDAQLIRFLMRSEHFSPFAMCQVKLHVRLPIFVHNQWVR